MYVKSLWHFNVVHSLMVSRVVVDMQIYKTALLVSLKIIVVIVCSVFLRLSQCLQVLSSV